MKNNISRINLKDLRHIYISLYEEIENYNIPFQKIELMLEQKQEIPPISEIFSQINLIMHLIKQNSHWDKIKRCGMFLLITDSLRIEAESFYALLLDFENFCKQNFEKTSGKFLTSDEQQDKERFQEFKTKVNKVLSLSQNLKNDIIAYYKKESIAREEEIKLYYKWGVISVYATIILVCATILLGIGQFILFSEQTQLQENQLNFIRDSFIPNAADLYFWVPDKTDLFFSKQQINWTANGRQDIVITFCLANKGRLPSGRITIETQSNGSESYWTDWTGGDIVGINSIDPAGFNCSNIKINPWAVCNIIEDGENRYFDCPYNKLPSGNQTIVFSIKCDGPCITKEKNETVQVCIWEHSGNECDWNTKN